MKRQWNHMDEQACKEAKAIAAMRVNEIRVRPSRIRYEELIPGLEKHEQRRL